MYNRYYLCFQALVALAPFFVSKLATEVAYSIVSGQSNAYKYITKTTSFIWLHAKFKMLIMGDKWRPIWY